MRNYESFQIDKSFVDFFFVLHLQTFTSLTFANKIVMYFKSRTSTQCAVESMG